MGQRHDSAAWLQVERDCQRFPARVGGRLAPAVIGVVFENEDVGASSLDRYPDPGTVVTVFFLYAPRIALNAALCSLAWLNNKDGRGTERGAAQEFVCRNPSLTIQVCCSGIDSKEKVRRDR